VEATEIGHPDLTLTRGLNDYFKKWEMGKMPSKILCL
jgi:hypothetical protein